MTLRESGRLKDAGSLDQTPEKTVGQRNGDRSGRDDPGQIRGNLIYGTCTHVTSS
jgi:hypothetical protein